MASIFARLLHPFRGTVTHGVVKLYGTVTTSTSGTVSTSSCDGFAITKTGSETGRYTIQIGSAAAPMVAAELLGCNVQVIGADDTVYTKDKGLGYFLRDNDVASDGTFEIQFTEALDSSGCTYPDTELEDGAKLLIEITLKNSSVSP
jgi:hypothetical protein